MQECVNKIIQDDAFEGLKVLKVLTAASLTNETNSL
tara:strand:- start:686 stop:793 length:108 start_codon:yes stop_codon:yes gene_type:complete